MRIGSLFSGYGGLDLAVESVLGGTPAWFVEFDQAPSRVLAHHWPDVPNYGDITAVDWDTVEPVDILTGGFPCQDLSHAGKRLGLRPGTRSGLWEHMAYAIDRLRPRLVVIENVRGLLSAEAHSDMERDCWCVGDDREPALRALGAVLGDLAELGYDARWGGVRAADAGAPHARFRVFIVAQPADADLAGLEGRPAERERAGERPAGPGGVGALVGVGPQTPEPVALGAGVGAEVAGVGVDQGVDGGESLGLGGGHASTVPVLAANLSMLPTTPQVHDGAKYCSDPAASQRRIDAGHQAMLTGSSGEQRPGQPDDAVRVVSPETALAGGPGGADGSRAPGTGDISGTWGPYAAAILRWEMVTGRVAPSPTEPGKDGRPRLSALAVEWMMGLPLGHVTDPAIGLTRAQQLKALGNGVVPQQAALALRLLLRCQWVAA